MDANLILLSSALRYITPSQKICTALQNYAQNSLSNNNIRKSIIFVLHSLGKNLQLEPNSNLSSLILNCIEMEISVAQRVVEILLVQDVAQTMDMQVLSYFYQLIF